MKNNYYIGQCNLKKLWDLGLNGEGLTIGVLDTGYTEHEAIPHECILCGKNFVIQEDYNKIFHDYNGHGTFIVSTILNIAQNVKIIVAKVLNKSGNGTLLSISKGLNYLIDNNVDVINASLGCYNTSIELHEAVKRCVDKGIPLVCACGNGRKICYPGYYEEVINVGAVDENREICDFSNLNRNVDFVAPGKNIRGCWIDNQYVVMDGTSFAVAIVSSVLILLKQKFKLDVGREPSYEELYTSLVNHTIEIKNTNKEQQCVRALYIDDTYL